MKESLEKFVLMIKRLTPKQIAMITMCVMLTVTVIVATVVIVKVSPVLSALLGTPDDTVPTEPSTETTVPPTTEPEETTPTTTPEATDPAHKHNYTILSKKVEATCTTAGYSIYRCQCGATEIQDLVDAPGHSYGPGKLVAATCTEAGYTKHICSVCGDEDKRDETEALGHDLQLIKAKDATCETPGNNAYYTCKTCGKAYQDEKGQVETTAEEEQLEALGHKYGEWKITAEPKKGNPGTETRTCTRSGCSGKETRDCELTMKEKSKEETNCLSYTIEMYAKDSKGNSVVVYTYYVTDYGKFPDMAFAYDQETGLIVTFTDKSGAQQTYALSDGGSLSINTDGKPGVPQTDPPESTGTGDPAESSNPTESSGNNE